MEVTGVMTALQAALARFHFERPWWLLAVPLLLALVVWLARRSAADGAWVSLVDAPLLAALRLSPPTVARNSPWPWLALVWTLAVLALAGPTWEREPVNANSAPDAWVLVLDLSPSMSATDMTPDRITRARYAVEDVLRAAQGARIGLVVFAEEGYVVTPLTDDMATVRGLTGPLAPGIVPRAGDKLAMALTLAGGLLERTTQRGGHVVVLTDGFTDAQPAAAAAERLRARQTRVDVIGFGGAGATTAVAAPPLDRKLLQRLADAGGGRVYGPTDMPSVVSGLRSQVTRQAATLTDVQAERWRDAGVWLLPPLLLLAALMARRGWW